MKLETGLGKKFGSNSTPKNVRVKMNVLDGVQYFKETIISRLRQNKFNSVIHNLSLMLLFKISLILKVNDVQLIQIIKNHSKTDQLLKI